MSNTNSNHDFEIERWAASFNHLALTSEEIHNIAPLDPISRAFTDPTECARLFRQIAEADEEHRNELFAAIEESTNGEAWRKFSALVSAQVEAAEKRERACKIELLELLQEAEAIVSQWQDAVKSKEGLSNDDVESLNPLAWPQSASASVSASAGRVAEILARVDDLEKVVNERNNI